MINDETQRQAAAAPEGANPRYTTGIYDIPVMGKPLRQAREVADSLRPTDEDTRGVRAGKNLARGSIVAGTTGLVMIAVF